MFILFTPAIPYLTNHFLFLITPEQPCIFRCITSIFPFPPVVAPSFKGWHKTCKSMPQCAKNTSTASLVSRPFLLYNCSVHFHLLFLIHYKSNQRLNPKEFILSATEPRYAETFRFPIVASGRLGTSYKLIHSLQMKCRNCSTATPFL